MTTRVTVALLVCLLTVQIATADIQHYLNNVPDYRWYHGCSPTSGGHLIGYWDNQPGYGNLYEGTAPMFAGSGAQPIDDMISSPEHNAASYNSSECTHSNAPPAGDTGPNSVACFMHTNPSTGGSWEWNIATGMRRYAAYDDPDTATNESMDFHSFVHYAPHANWTGAWQAASFGFDDYRRQIDAGNPMLLNWSLIGGGHSVIGYGYWERDDGSRWFSVRDTWQDNNSNGSWGITALDDNGQEWWRWDEHEAGDVIEHAYYLDDGVYFAPDDRGPIRESGDFTGTLTLDHSMTTIYANLAAAGDEDWFRVFLEVGEDVIVSTQDDEGGTASIDTEILLVEPDLVNGWSYDGLWAGYTNTDYAMRQVDEEGWWYVGVRGANGEDTGDYTVTVFRGETPEPGTMILFGVGLAAFAARRRRRCAKKS